MWPVWPSHCHTFHWRFLLLFMLVPSHSSAAMWCFHQVLGLTHQPLECHFAGHELHTFITWHVMQCVVNRPIRGEIPAAITVRSGDWPEGASASINLQPQVTHRPNNWTGRTLELSAVAASKGVYVLLRFCKTLFAKESEYLGLCLCGNNSKTGSL